MITPYSTDFKELNHHIQRLTHQMANAHIDLGAVLKFIITYIRDYFLTYSVTI